MKRSEMVDILIQADKDADKELGIGCSLYNYFSFILDRAEKAGMKAPEYEYIDYNLPHHDNVILKNEWEPEDEA